MSNRRGPRLALCLLQGGAILLFFGCSQPRIEPSPIALAADNSVAKQVEAIKLERKRIDAVRESPESGNRQRISKDLPHWQFSGLFESSKPIFLDATFSEGQVVREETYYIVGEKLLLVRVEKWWDVDDARRAPEPKSRHDFYIDKDRTIRHVTAVESSPPASRTDDAVVPATALTERSRSILDILRGGSQAAATAASLEALPEADTSKP